MSGKNIDDIVYIETLAGYWNILQQYSEGYTKSNIVMV